MARSPRTSLEELQGTLQRLRAYREGVPDDHGSVPDVERRIQELERRIAGVHEESATAAEDAARAERDAQRAERDARGARRGADTAPTGAYGRANQRFMGAQRNAVRRTKGFYDRWNSRFVGLQKRIDTEWHPGLFALVVILVHAYDALAGPEGFSRSGGLYGHGSLMLLVYLLVALYASFFVYKTGFTPESGRYFGVSAFAFFLPYIFGIPFLADNDYLVFVLTVTPVWFLFHANNAPEDSLFRTVGRWWVGAVVIFFAIIAFAGITLPGVFDVVETGANVGGSVLSVTTDFTDAAYRIKDRLAAGCLFDRECITVRINQTFNPYWIVYQGQVEGTEREPTGVFITNLRPLSREFPNGTDVTITARLEAKTFLEKPVYIRTSCLLDGARREFEATPVPDGALEVNYQLIRDVTCTFPADPEMGPGSYYGVIGASFNFETWAYITNTFVSKNLIQSYYVDDKDINRELDIDRTTQAIYTNGPVELGVSADRQPIDIDPAATDATRIVQQNFGFSLRSRWTDGEIKHVREAVVIVPQPFVLNDCKPAPPASVVADDALNVTNYTFNLPLADGRLDYRSVTCQLDLPSQEAARQVLSYGPKVPVTFVVIADYDYELEERTSVRIKR